MNKQEIQNKCELELMDASDKSGELFYGKAFETFKKYLDISENEFKDKVKKLFEEHRDGDGWLSNGDCRIILESLGVKDE